MSLFISIRDSFSLQVMAGECQSAGLENSSNTNMTEMKLFYLLDLDISWLQALCD